MWWMCGWQPYRTLMSLYTSALMEGSEHDRPIAAVPHEEEEFHQVPVRTASKQGM